MERIVDGSCLHPCPRAVDTSLVWGWRGSQEPRVALVMECSDARQGVGGNEYMSALADKRCKTGQMLAHLVGEVVPWLVMTNAVKCLVGGGGKPGKAEYRQCAPLTLTMLGKYQPEVVVACGVWAARVFMPELAGINGIAGLETSVDLTGGMPMVSRGETKLVLVRHPRVMTKMEMELVAKTMQRVL